MHDKHPSTSLPAPESPGYNSAPQDSRSPHTYLPDALVPEEKFMLTGAKIGKSAPHAASHQPRIRQLPRRFTARHTASIHMHDWFHQTPNTSLNSFPFNNFRYYLTPISRFFSSFAHATCSLSVSGPYLALGEVYLPLRAAFPNYPTLRVRLISAATSTPAIRDSHPLWSSIPGHLARGCHQKTPLKTTILHAQRHNANSKSELFPLHSPLLRESLLLSLPPLSYMLKFRGFLCLIWDQNVVFFSPSCCSNRESYQTGLHFCFCFRMIAPRQKGLLLKNCTERSHRECNEFSFPHKNWRVTLTHQVKNKNENSFSLFSFSWALSASTGHTQSMQHHSFQAIQYSGAMRDVGEKNTHDKRNAFFSSFLFPFFL